MTSFTWMHQCNKCCVFYIGIGNIRFLIFSRLKMLLLRFQHVENRPPIFDQSNIERRESMNVKRMNDFFKSSNRLGEGLILAMGQCGLQSKLQLRSRYHCVM